MIIFDMSFHDVYFSGGSRMIDPNPGDRCNKLHQQFPHNHFFFFLNLIHNNDQVTVGLFQFSVVNPVVQYTLRPQGAQEAGDNSE